MSLARVKSWIAAEVLYASDLNAEIDNILNNALSLISPLTGNLACGDNDLTGIDELAFTSAGADATASGRLRRNGTWLTWHDGVAARGLGVKTIRKTADETVNNSATLQNDDHLVYALAASEVVAFECRLTYNTGATPDIKFAFTVPASATLKWNTVGAWRDNGGTVVPQTDVAASGTAMAFGGFGAPDDTTVTLSGTVVNSTNAGNLQLQWAQDTANGSDTIVRANSWMRVTRF